MSRVLCVVVLLGVLVPAVGMSSPSVPRVRGLSEGDMPIVATGDHNSPSPAAVESYVFTYLQHNAFLRSDESAVLYVENVIQNWDYVPMDRHTWCFYWGLDAYSNVFARDSFGYMEVDYYEHYSYDYGKWGLCIEAVFTHPIGLAEDYYYGVGVTIDQHHTVSGDLISAQWRVTSDSSIVHYVDVASWPHNHEGVTAEPTPDELGNDYAKWERTNAEAPWEFTVNLTVALGDHMAVEPLSQGTRPFDGEDVPWEDDDYGVGTNWTIGQKGCYLTCGTMLINYFAKLEGYSSSVDPLDLHYWLAEPYPSSPDVPRGYDSSSDCPSDSYCLVDGYSFDSASADLFETQDVDDKEQPLVVRTETEGLSTISDMRDNIQNGELGILNVNNEGYGHFVLATGYITTEQGVETVLINDPYENRGSTTLLDQYNNSYAGSVQWYSSITTTIPNYVELAADCPVELLVTDELGRRTGYDPRVATGYDEIPLSSYVEVYYPHDVVAEDDPTKVLQIQTMDFSEYTLRVIGTGTGSYSLSYHGQLAYADDQRITISGETVPGQVDEYTITFDPNKGFFIHEVFLPLVTQQQ